MIIEYRNYPSNRDGKDVKCAKTDLQSHLCEECAFSIPNCNPEFMDFGRGLGNDNVIACSQFTPANQQEEGK